MSEPPQRKRVFQPAPKSRRLSRRSSTSSQEQQQQRPITHQDYIQHLPGATRHYNQTVLPSTGQPHPNGAYLQNATASGPQPFQPPPDREVYQEGHRRPPLIPVSNVARPHSQALPSSSQSYPNGHRGVVGGVQGHRSGMPVPKGGVENSHNVGQRMNTSRYKSADVALKLQVFKDLQDTFLADYRIDAPEMIVKTFNLLIFLLKNRPQRGVDFGEAVLLLYQDGWSQSKERSKESNSSLHLRSAPAPAPNNPPPPPQPYVTPRHSVGASPSAAGAHRHVIQEVAQRVLETSHPLGVPRGASPEPSESRLIQETTHTEEHDPIEEAIIMDPIRLNRENFKANILRRFNDAVVTWTSVPNINDVYQLWKDPSAKLPALLPRTMLNPYEELQNVNRQLTVSQAGVLRFLWLSLVKTDEEGVCLSGSMGLLRIHQVMVFASMFVKAMSQARKRTRILVLTPHNVHLEWSYVFGRSPKSFSRYVIPNPDPNAVARTMRVWGERGGLLVCSESLYIQLMSEGDLHEQARAREWLVNPGPDVIVLDEASRLPAMDERVCRMLRQTRTKKRLALTSISLGGNLETWWHILDWACPSLLGDLEEYRHVYVRTIAKGLSVGSPEEIGQRSYRTAASLFAFVHPVVYPSHGLYKIDKNLHRRVRIDSVTVYTNMIGDQINLYTRAARYLSKKVQQNAMSAFVAAHVLTVIGSSPKALKPLMLNGAEVRQRCLASKRLKLDLLHVHSMFQALNDTVKRLYSTGMSVSKIAICRHMYEKCVAARENMVIFSHSMEIQNVLFDMMKRYNTEGGVVLKWDTELPFDARNRLLVRFKEQEGACLIAPYGPTLNCREASGWGDLPVSVAIIADSGWHAIAEAQCVKRLYSAISNRESNRVTVINLVTTGGIEQIMYDNLLVNLFDKEVRRIRESDGPTAAPIHDNSYQRSYLAFPQIPMNWVCEKNIMENYMTRGTVDTDDTTEGIMEHDNTHLKALSTLLDVKFSQNSYAVCRISARYNRVAAVATVAEMCTRAPLRADDNEISNYELRRQVVDHERRMEHIAVEMDSSSRMMGNQALSSLQDHLSGMIGTLRPEEGMQTHQVSSLCTLAALWEPYYDLYDQRKKNRN